MNRGTKTTALAAVALLLAACGGPTAPSTGLKDATDAQLEDVNRTDPAKLKDGGELRWPVTQLADNWNNFELTGTHIDGYRMISTVMPSPFVLKADSTVAENPDYLLEAKLVSSSPQVVTYRLNPKARWSDGRQFSWEDFAAQANALSGKAAGYKVALTAGYEDIAKVERGGSDQDVKVTFARTYAEWRGLFSPLYPKQAMASAEAFNTGWQDAPQVTAGPFKIGTIDPVAKFVTVVRDDTWWGARPKLDSITFRQVDKPALADALANGAIDLYEVGSSIDLFTRAQSIPGVTVRQAQTPDYLHLTFNGGGTLADPKLRVALMRGIDTKIITKALLGQMVKDEAHVVGNHFLLLGSKDYRDNSAVASFDVEAARKELDALGWRMNGEYRAKDGKELVVRFVGPTPNPVSDQISKLVLTQFKEIGVKLAIETVPASTSRGTSTSATSTSRASAGRRARTRSAPPRASTTSTPRT
ncbi:ABC transporter family substrate-binding protein [Lentzea guizhouensis]|uniref:ABC transporter family substrate-binding protein n=1 Tax=Lentzea guizhouensis TaxID=1586287 RepID=UPI001C54C507|nr:ABC transporter family substrate-binding protein [Lentzea guizhouensis]